MQGLVHEELAGAVAQIEVVVEGRVRRLVGGVHAAEGAVARLGHDAHVRLVHLPPLVRAEVVRPQVAEVLVEPAAAAGHVQAVAVVGEEGAVAGRRPLQAERQLAPLL